MVFARSMETTSTPPLLARPTGLAPLQNHSCPLTASPLPSRQPEELPGAPAWLSNATTAGRPPDAPSPGEVAAASVFFGSLWLLSICGNFLVCLVIHRSRRTQSTSNYFVVSMACADLLLSVGSTPFVLLQFAAGRWTLGSALCKAARYFQYLTPGVQVYVLLSICIDRFYTIVYPLSFKVSREKAKKMIAASWVLEAAFLIPVFFFFGSSGQDGHCNYFLPPSWEGTAYSVLHLLVGFAIPSAFIVLFYQKVVKYIWRIGTDGRTVRRTMNVVPRTKVKTVKMFLTLSLLFLLSWLPFHVAQLWHPPEQDSKRSSLVFTAVTWISFSSSASKPTLYSIYNANFRRGMKETFCMSSMKCYRSNAYTITTSSRIAKKNYVGISEIPPSAKTITKDSIYDSFDRDAKEKKLAWPINSNPPNTFV